MKLLYFLGERGNEKHWLYEDKNGIWWVRSTPNKGN